MTPDHRSPRVPPICPSGSRRGRAQLADLYFSGTTAAFVLHGNTYDLFRDRATRPSRYGVLAEFLAEQLFGRWSLVLHYDLGRGLRAFAGRDEKRLKEMVALANRKIGDLSALAKDPAADASRSSIASSATTSWRRTTIASASRVILDQASYVFPAGEPGRLSCRPRRSS